MTLVLLICGLGLLGFANADAVIGFLDSGSYEETGRMRGGRLIATTIACVYLFAGGAYALDFTSDVAFGGGLTLAAVYWILRVTKPPANADVPLEMA